MNTSQTILLGLIIAFLAPTATQPAGPMFSRSDNYCALSLSYRDLAALIERIVALRESASRNKELLQTQEQLMLKAGDTGIRIEGNVSDSSLLNGPEVATQVRYYFLDLDGNAPISEVERYFVDSVRSLRVSGTSKERVDAIISTISDDIAKLGCAWGGSNFRLLGGMLLIVSALVVGLFGNTYFASPRATYPILALVIMLKLGVWIPPWEKWLPGTAVYVGEASFAARNSAEIGVLGFVLGLVSVVLTIWFGIRRGSLAVEAKDGEGRGGSSTS